MSRHALSLVLTLALATACTRADASDAAAASTSDTTATAAVPAASAPTPAGVVDSIVPIPVALERFKEGLDPVAALADGAGSRDELVGRFVRAVATQDTSAINRLALTRNEFAYLYYPHTRYTAKPYEMAPALLWFVIGQNSEKGITRVFRRIGGEPLDLVGYGCPAQPTVEGPNRIWEECRLRLRAADGTETEHLLFGSILERHGRFKFVSYANEL